jgi:hypothetical protein
MTKVIKEQVDFRAALESFKVGMEQLSGALASKNATQPTKITSPTTPSKTTTSTKTTTGASPTGDTSGGSRATKGFDPAAPTTQMTADDIAAIADESDGGLGRVVKNLIPKLEKAGLKIVKA